MVDEKLGSSERIIDKLEGLKSKKEVRVTRLDIILAEEFENKEKEHNLMDQIIKEARADENPLRIKEYASEVAKKVDTRYNKIEDIRDHIVGEIHAIDYLKKEIKRRTILSTKSHSNEEEITEKKKKWIGGKNE